MTHYAVGIIKAVKDQETVDDFVNGFKQYMNDNPDVRATFAESWYNADNRTIRDIVDDYIMELETQP